MIIEFEHKGSKIKGKVIHSTAVKDIVIVFPESNLGELGWSHYFQRKENKWISPTFLKDKYPDTYSSMLLEVMRSETSLDQRKKDLATPVLHETSPH